MQKTISIKIGKSRWANQSSSNRRKRRGCMHRLLLVNVFSKMWRQPQGGTMPDQAVVKLEVRSDGIAVLTLDNPPLNLNTLLTLKQLKDAEVEISTL